MKNETDLLPSENLRLKSSDDICAILFQLHGSAVWLIPCISDLCDRRRFNWPLKNWCYSIGIQIFKKYTCKKKKKKRLGKYQNNKVPHSFIGLNLQLQCFSSCRDCCIKQAAFLSVALCTACPLAKHSLISWTVLAAVRCLQSSALNCIIINIHVPRKQSK